MKLRDLLIVASVKNRKIKLLKEQILVFIIADIRITILVL